MARAVERLAEHWLKTRGKRQSHVIELGTAEQSDPLEVFWSPWTLGQQDFVFHDMRPGEAFRPSRNARVLIVKAETADGEKMFAGIEEIDLLSRVDPTLVKSLADKILVSLNGDGAAGKDASEGSGADPKAGTTTGTTSST